MLGKIDNSTLNKNLVPILKEFKIYSDKHTYKQNTGKSRQQ